MYVTTFLLISFMPWQPHFDHVGTRKLTHLTWRMSWWGKRWSPLPPHLSFDYKTVTHPLTYPCRKEKKKKKQNYSPLSSQGGILLPTGLWASQTSYFNKSFLIYHCASRWILSAVKHKEPEWLRASPRSISTVSKGSLWAGVWPSCFSTEEGQL